MKSWKQVENITAAKNSMLLTKNWTLALTSCILEHEEFDIVCLKGAVLRTELVTMADVAAETREPLTNR